MLQRIQSARARATRSSTWRRYKRLERHFSFTSLRRNFRGAAFRVVRRWTTGRICFPENQHAEEAVDSASVGNLTRSVAVSIAYSKSFAQRVPNSIAKFIALCVTCEERTGLDAGDHVTGTGSTFATPTPRDAQRQASPAPTSGAMQRLPVMEVKDFPKHYRTADGTSYALLIVWSFIAGFAERLVPDTLNRVVSKNQSIWGN